MALRALRSAPLALAIAIGGVVVVDVGIATANIPNQTTGTISACYQQATGALRVIDADAGAKCRPDEKPLAWGQTGPQGPAGGIRETHLPFILSGNAVSPCDGTTAWQTQGTGCPGSSDPPPAAQFNVDGSKYPAGTSAVLDTLAKVTPDHLLCIRVFDEATGTPLSAPVCPTSSTPGGWVRAASAPFSVPSGWHSIALQISVEPATTYGGDGIAIVGPTDLVITAP